MFLHLYSDHLSQKFVGSILQGQDVKSDQRTFFDMFAVSTMWLVKSGK